MKSIKITDSKKVAAIQKEFNEMFPFLKLEFFHHKHKAFKGSSKRDLFDTELTLKQCRKKSNEGTLIVKESMKVSDLEELFQSVFGLSTQVFRKSGKSWIETTVTDDWTLKQQNDEGKELSFLSK